MASNFKDIFEFKASKIEADKVKILSVIKTELSKFNFEDDYLKEGGLEVISCSEVRFHTCTLENFTDTRSISEANRPNKYNIQVGSRRISEFNSWDYKLSYNKKFKNSDDNHSIEESHHAIGCGTCKQHGKIRCSSCLGAGDITCSSCSGRGEKQCRSCSGRGEIKCWSCSGKGTKESGYGDNKRIERCSSCSGRGYEPCSSCRNGYVTCDSCSGRGRVTCYTCHGSREVTCYQCEGYRTMDHYFIVNAKFINLHQRLFVTNPFPGFDNSRASEVGFAIQNKLFEFKENRFKDGYFEQLQLHPLYRQICASFDFKDSDKTKLISSRITFFENKYFEVSFSFYGDTYTIYLDQNYLDQNLSKSYYGGKKPSDQYELDLLNKSLKSASNNELDIAKKTIQKLSKYDFISINEKYIVAAIDDTQNIYKAKNGIDNRNYSYAESTLKLVSDEKKNESDYERLIKRLNRIYFTNTTIIGFVSFTAIYFKLIDKDNQFIQFNISISIGILFVCWLVNRATRSIHWSRWLVLLLFSVQFFGIIYFENKEGNKIRSAKALQESFDAFKGLHYTIFNGQDSIILIEPTGQERRNYYLPKGKPYRLDIGGGQKFRERIAESKMYLNIEQQSFENARGSYKVTVALKDNNSVFRFDIEAHYDDIRFDNDDNDIEIRYMRNSLDEFKLNNINTMFISNSSWQAVKGGAKSIYATKPSENQVSAPSADSAPSVDEINPISRGETIYEGEGELIDNYTKYNNLCIKDLNTNLYWYIAPDRGFSFEEANTFANTINERNLSWRLPTFNEIRNLYNSDYTAGKGYLQNNEYYPAKIHYVFNSIGSGSWFWVSDRNNNSSEAYAINLHEGIRTSFDVQNSKYPVHLLLISK